ncbi:MAG: thiamine-phosphate kinase [Geodermatophilaceae bacterium]|nr:thiamine-phosphate kinase [Geodermatophilaceae bacterium]
MRCCLQAVLSPLPVSPTEEAAITVSELGEFGTVERVIARSGLAHTTVVGPGDDAAVLNLGGGLLVASTDLLVEGRHFRRDWAPAKDIGHRAAAANLADIAAMGARPTGLLVGLAMPGDLPIAWLDDLYEGLREECQPFGAAVLGGDVVESKTLILAVSALGDMKGARPVTRDGALVGHRVAVAGRLGYAAAGLAVLGRGFRSPGSVVAAYRRPEVPYAAGPQAAALGASAMCDVSDGLLRDAGTVAAGSSVRIVLDVAKFMVPDVLRDVGTAMNTDPLRWIFTGGDDHALLACFPPHVELPAPWREVGWVEAGTGVRVAGLPDEGRELAGSGFAHWG